ncbi:hypothetical protein L5G28_03660 [Gordonia sp. HY285]|uniref:hypothetical protein n=1 Tax=Gordonia liuliyuniae TaxID=2911517 RepID=UPI001F1FB9DE|nr:hypothetical protein [Gordonia liuliyuniae]MCF8609260.1 hypothetical protein [Gordonia liuliyuniae]
MTTVAPAPTQRERPGQSDIAPLPGRTTAPADVPVGQPHPGSSNEAFLSPSTDGEPTIRLPIWVIAGAAAVAAASPRGRSLLKRGGSTRATVGPSRMVLMHDESSPTTYRFAMNVPDGGYTKVNPDGSATVYDKDGNAIRQVARPWAFDAAGRPQKTWYTVDENGDLVQHIEPADNALFPILADPTETTGAAASATAGASVGASAGSEAPAGESAGEGDNAIAGMLTPLVQGGSTANGLGPEAGAPATPTQPETAPDHIPNAFGVGEQKAEQPAPDSSAQTNSDALGDLMNPSFDGSATPESSEPEFNPYNPLTYPETGQGSDGQTQSDQAQSDALGDLLMPSFDGSDSPESSEPEFNPYNPLTYPETSQSGDGDGQTQADQAQSDALGELLMPSFTKEPQPDGRVDAPAAGQSMTYTEWLRYTNNQRLDGRVHERVADDGTLSYYDLSRGPNGEQIEGPVTGFGTALENETVYNFGDGTGKTGTGQPAVQDTNGNWWVINHNGPNGSFTRSAVVNGEKLEIAVTPLPHGGYLEYDRSGTNILREFDRHGNLIGAYRINPDDPEDSIPRHIGKWLQQPDRAFIISEGGTELGALGAGLAEAADRASGSQAATVARWAKRFNRAGVTGTALTEGAQALTGEKPPVQAIADGIGIASAGYIGGTIGASVGGPVGAAVGAYTGALLYEHKQGIIDAVKDPVDGMKKLGGTIVGWLS